MRILYLYCHPLPESLHGAIRDRAVAALREAGHTVDLCDLYAEGFDPVLSPEDRRRYHDLEQNQQGLEDHVHRLRAAEGMVVQFPTWCFGPPAMLKGYFDRLFMPGVSFDLSDPANVKPLLTHIRKLAGIVTYGRPRWMAMYMGDPPRKLVTRYIRRLTANRASTRYHALYHLNIASEQQRRGFIDGVEAAMRRF